MVAWLCALLAAGAFVIDQQKVHKTDAQMLKAGQWLRAQGVRNAYEPEPMFHRRIRHAHQYCTSVVRYKTFVCDAMLQRKHDTALRLWAKRPLDTGTLKRLGCIE